MTIKEIEELSGMPRANVRYYEAQGLLTPYRGENGYRDYSLSDLRTLQRIRLLRAVGMSLEDIKAVQTGRMTLSASLYELEQELSDTQTHLDWAKETCRLLRKDDVTYETLDAARYFDRLPPAQPQDTIAEPTFYGPWRRYIARWLDMSIYKMVIMCLCCLLFSMRPQLVSDLDLLWTILALVATGFVEPVLLCKFGTTLGKWLLGLHITDLDGNRPDYDTAKNRTWGALFWGRGLEVPFFQIVRLWKSYHGCVARETLPWEYETNQVLRSRKPWKEVMAAGVFAVSLTILLLVTMSTDTVPHKGDLTPQEFCDNYNALLDYYENGGLYLHPSGNFDETGQTKDGAYIVVIDDDRWSANFTEENGIVKSVTVTCRSGSGFVGGHENRITYLVLAAVKSRVSALSFAGENFVQQMMKVPFGDYEGTVRGITVTRDWEYTGYEAYAGAEYLVSGEEDENRTAVMKLTLEFG